MIYYNPPLDFSTSDQNDLLTKELEKYLKTTCLRFSLITKRPISKQSLNICLKDKYYLKDKSLIAKT